MLVKNTVLFAYRGIGKREKFKKNIGRTILSMPVDFLVGFYVYMVGAITLLSRTEGSTDIVNLTLFSTFTEDLAAKAFILENILMFVPLGIFLFWYGMKSGILAFLFSGAMSAAIEYTQYYTGRGKAEVDDLFTNVLGAMIGYITIKMLSKAMNFFHQ